MHSSLAGKRRVRFIVTNSKGELMVGVGRKPTGFFFAKDCFICNL